MAVARVAMSLGNLTAANAALIRADELLRANTLWAGRAGALRGELALRFGDPHAAAKLLGEIRARQVAAFGADSAELAATDEWLGVSYARMAAASEASTHFANSCRLRAIVRPHDHPQRIRCDAYRILVDPQYSSSAKAAEIGRLETLLTTGRGDRTPLIASLQKARAAANAGIAVTAENFPILN
jgi:hypothetical protein